MEPASLKAPRLKILSSSSSDASATAVDTEDDFLVTNDDTNPDYIPAVQNDVLNSFNGD